MTQEKKMNEIQIKYLKDKEIEKKQSQSLFSRLLRLLFSPEFIKQGFIFAIVGAIGTLVNLSILYLLTDFFKILYLISEAIAFTVSVINNYIFNKIYTFKENIREKILKKGIKFSIICVLALIVNLIVLFVLVEFFHIFYLLAEIFAIVCAFGINFLGNRFWTFRYKVVEMQKRKKINKSYIEILMAFWLLILGSINIVIGFMKNDLIFQLLGLPTIIVSIIILVRLPFKGYFEKNKNK